MRTDKELAADFYRRGNHRAYTELVHRYSGLLFNIALGILGDRSMSEDAVQDTFMALLSTTKPYRGEGSFRAWLSRIAVSKSLNAMEKRKRDQGRPFAVEPEDRSCAKPDSGQKAALRTLVANLPAALKVPLILKFFQDFTQAEIAVTLECSTGTVSNRIRDGLNRLRKSLAEAGLASLGPGLESVLQGVENEEVSDTLLRTLEDLPKHTRTPPAPPARNPRIPKALRTGALIAVSALLLFLGVLYVHKTQTPDGLLEVTPAEEDPARGGSTARPADPKIATNSGAHPVSGAEQDSGGPPKDPGVVKPDGLKRGVLNLVNENGDAVEEAWVYFVTRADLKSRFGEFVVHTADLRAAKIPLCAPVGGKVRGPFRSLTKGRVPFELRDLDPEEFVVVFHRVYAVKAMSAKRLAEDAQRGSSSRMVLATGKMVEGSVTDAQGLPVEGSRVAIQPLRVDRPGILGSMKLGCARRSRTNHLGLYRIAGLSPGAYFVTAFTDKGKEVTELVHILESSWGLTVDFVLKE